MKMGVHKDTLADSLTLADQVYLYQADNLGWDIAEQLKKIKYSLRLTPMIILL